MSHQLTKINDKLRQFYEKPEVGLTGRYEECAGCGILLCSGMDKVPPKFFNLATSGQQEPLWRAFTETVILTLGEQHFDLSGERIRSVEALADYLAEFVLSECQTCGRRFCIACRSGPRRETVCNQCRTETPAGDQPQSDHLPRLVGSLVLKQTQQATTTYYIHPGVIRLFEQSQRLPWTKWIAVELLRTQNEFESDFVTDAMADDCENWSGATDVTYQGQSMSAIRYRPTGSHPRSSSDGKGATTGNPPAIPRDDAGASAAADADQPILPAADAEEVGSEEQLPAAAPMEEPTSAPADDTGSDASADRPEVGDSPASPAVAGAGTSSAEPASADPLDEDWTHCSYCGTPVKRKNIGRHEGKCGQRYGKRSTASGTTAQPASTTRSGQVKQDKPAHRPADLVVENTSATIGVLYAAGFLAVVWVGVLSDLSLGMKLLLTLASPCVLFGMALLVMVPLWIVSTAASRYMQRRGVAEASLDGRRKAVQLAGVAIGLGLLPIAVSILVRKENAAAPGPPSYTPAVRSDKREASDRPQPATAPGGSDDPAPPTAPGVESTSRTDRERLARELRETREKLNELKQKRANLSGPLAASIDSAIETLEASVDSLEQILDQ